MNSISTLIPLFPHKESYWFLGNDRLSSIYLLFMMIMGMAMIWITRMGPERGSPLHLLDDLTVLDAEDQ